jgi:hypothetical protein
MRKTLYYNGYFHSMSDEDTCYQAILCDDFRIIEAYHRTDKNLFSQDFRLIDLCGCHVYPGFIDSHTHSFEGGLYQNGADLSKCQSIADVLDCLKGTPAMSSMIFAWRFDENLIREKRFPTRIELDKVFPNIPVLLRRIDGHSCVVNSAAIDMIANKNKHFTCNEADVWRGLQNDTAAHTFHKNLSDEAVLSCYKTTQKIALKSGHTGIHTMIGDAQEDPLHFHLLLNHLHDFAIDFTPYPQCFALKKVLDIYGTHPQQKKIGGCILADGSFGSMTAAISTPYLDTENFGVLYRTQDSWDEFFHLAHAQDMQVAVHCIGDMAISQILKAIDKANTQSLKDLRHQIVHCEYVTDEMLPLFIKNNVSAVMQPMFDALWGGTRGFYARMLGEDRIKYLNRFRTLHENGITLAGSSDWYITDMSALDGIHAAVHHHNSSESLPPFEAVKMYTTNPHKLTFCEHERGLIKKDYIADMVCLDKDILTTKDIKSAKVVRVIRHGDVAFLSDMETI